MHTGLPSGGKSCLGCSLCFWASESEEECPLRDRPVSIVLHLSFAEFLKVHSAKRTRSVWEVLALQTVNLLLSQQSAALQLVWSICHSNKAARRHRLSQLAMKDGERSP